MNLYNTTMAQEKNGWSPLYIIQTCIDVIFPPSIEHNLVRRQTVTTFSLWYKPNKMNNVHYLSSYQLPAIRAAIITTKFERNTHAAHLLASLVSTWLQTQPNVPTLLIPIPLNVARERKRGFNQVSKVLSYVTLPPHHTVATDILYRVRNTKPQTSLPLKERQENLIGAFVYQVNIQKKYPSVRRIILCDDVLTTGATMKAAKAALSTSLPPDVELICLTWAH